MTKSYGRQGDEATRGLVDASAGDFYRPAQAPARVVIYTETDPRTGLPVSKPEGSGYWDPRCLRFHDLARELPLVGPDRRLAFQLLLDYDGPYADPREPNPDEGVPEDAPFGQPERFTSSNRTTRWADTADRVALPTSFFRLIGSEDGRDAVAMAVRGPKAPEVPPVTAGLGDLELPEGVRIDEPGAIDATGANSGGGILMAPRVMIGGVSFFGPAAVEAAKRVARAGGSAFDIANAASHAARGLPPPPMGTRERGKPPEPPPTKPAGSVTPANHPLGYVWDETSGRIGLAGTLLQAGAIGTQYFFGREGTPINRLAIRTDGHFALDEGHTGAIMFKPGDGASIPESTEGTPVKGVMLFDTSVANQDTEVGQETGKWRPVVYIRAQDIEPPPPPQPPPHVQPPPENEPPPSPPEEGPGRPKRPETGGDTADPQEDPPPSPPPFVGVAQGWDKYIIGSGHPGPGQSSAGGGSGHPGVHHVPGWIVLGGELDEHGQPQGGYAIKVPDGYTPAEGTVASVPMPRGMNLADWLAWAAYALQSQQVITLGAFGGSSFLNSPLTVVSKGPESRGSIVGQHAQGTRTGRTVGGALVVMDVLEAGNGQAIRADATQGLLTITRDHRGQGVVDDRRPMLLLDDRTKRRQGDVLTTGDRRFAVTSSRGVISTGVQVVVEPTSSGPAIAVGTRDPVTGAIVGDPVHHVTTGGAGYFAAGVGGDHHVVRDVDEVEDFDGIQVTTQGAAIVLLDDDGAETSSARLVKRGNKTTLTVDGGDGMAEIVADKITCDVLDPYAVVFDPYEFPFPPVEFSSIKPGLYSTNDSKDPDDGGPFDAYWFDGSEGKRLAYADEVSGGDTLPPGSVQAFAGSTTPTGWLDCDGSAVSRTTYADLFAAIGTTWGAGDGATTFNLPDFRGRALIGAGTGPGLSARTLGQQNIGAETHALNQAEMPPHTHAIPVGTGPGSSAVAGPTGLAGGLSTASAGTGLPHNNMQPSAVVKWIIKT